MRHYSIAVYPGDGIGIDVVNEAVNVLRAAQSVYGFSLELSEFDWGSRYWKTTGRVAPDDFLKTLAGFDAIFLGALGDPRNVPDHITLEPLIAMRQGFDQYACLRPAKLLPNVPTPLNGKGPGDIDLVVVRENSEGEYASAGGRMKAGTPGDIAIQTAIHTRRGVDRILRYAFDLALCRRKRLTMATKSNALKFSMVMWDEALDALAPRFPGVAVEKCHVDALTMHLVRRPEAYDVIVGSNLFGDILSDLAGAISGSLGLAPSANLNPERKFPSLFEPVHGSAPDIAGKGIANPLAAIRSAAMMLDFLGEKEAAAGIESAVTGNLRAGAIRTPDLGGAASTTAVGEDVVRRIRCSDGKDAAA